MPPTQEADDEPEPVLLCLGQLLECIMRMKRMMVATRIAAVASGARRGLGGGMNGSSEGFAALVISGWCRGGDGDGENWCEAWSLMRRSNEEDEEGCC